tara:strand:+ start:5201 stop:5464 length:264 start_codon:yes stop_codon:yes gene_type:complete
MVAFGTTRGLSQRRACELFGTARSALRFESRMAVKDAPALRAVHRLAHQYPRFGYRRIVILLGREGFTISSDGAVVAKSLSTSAQEA